MSSTVSRVPGWLAAEFVVPSSTNDVSRQRMMRPLSRLSIQNRWEPYVCCRDKTSLIGSNRLRRCTATVWQLFSQPRPSETDPSIRPISLSQRDVNITVPEGEKNRLVLLTTKFAF